MAWYCVYYNLYYIYLYHTNERKNTKLNLSLYGIHNIINLHVTNTSTFHCGYFSQNTALLSQQLSKHLTILFYTMFAITTQQNTALIGNDLVHNGRAV